MKKVYSLPDLPYGLKALEPHISEEQLRVHHQKHHQNYVDKANATLEKIQEARAGGTETDIKALLRFLSFNVGGHILHSLFWQNLMPPADKNAPSGVILDAINEEFGSFERFRYEFSDAALTAEGSGWAALCYEKEGNGLLIAQIEKHNLFLYPDSQIIMVLDMWEHAYYLDCKNDKAAYVAGFWSIANWARVNNRFESL